MKIKWHEWFLIELAIVVAIVAITRNYPSVDKTYSPRSVASDKSRWHLYARNLSVVDVSLCDAYHEWEIKSKERVESFARLCPTKER